MRAFYTTPPHKSTALRLIAAPLHFGVIELPVENLVRRPMRPSERNLVVACWWAMRRAGVKLPAEKGVIVIDGGAP